jgi:hypothetical protein
MSMTEKQEITLGKKSTITLGLAIAIVVSIAGGAVTFINMRQADKDENREGREKILAEIRGLREEVRNDKSAMNARVEAIERGNGDRWTSSMMEIWVLRSRESGELVDPAPIIQRYKP